MPPLFIFAFGPTDSFLFFCATKLITHRAGGTFVGNVCEKLGTPYSLTLGPGENEYAAIYLDKNDNRMWRHINYIEGSHLREIRPILSAKDIGSANSYSPDERVSIGGIEKNGNYPYVIVKTNSVVRSSKAAPLPATLNAALDSATKHVSDVVLGYGGAWFVQFADGTYQFSFAGHYRELAQVLQGVTHVQHLAVSRYSPEHYFLVYGDNRKVRYSMLAAFESVIVPLIKEYHESCKTVSGSVDAEIQPETDAAADRSPPPYEIVSDQKRKP